MADFDRLSDMKGLIINFIDEKARDLFYTPVNEYNVSPWIQTAVLFEEVIIPCRYYFPESLFGLAEEMIKVAESKGCKAEYYQVKDGKKVNVQVWDYTESINKIKKWLKEELRFREELELS